MRVVGNGPMTEERVQRRIAAILAAEVVGYSRLMGEDEKGTLAAPIQRSEVGLGTWGVCDLPVGGHIIRSDGRATGVTIEAHKK